jgi:hypothetical protein
VKAMLAVDRINLRCDAEPVASLKALHIAADDLSPTGATIASVLVDGGRLSTTRTEQGLLRVAGLEVGGAAPASNQATKQSVASRAQASPPETASPAPRFALAVRSVKVRDFAAMLRDLSVSPPNELQFTLLELGTRGDGISIANVDANVPSADRLGSRGSSTQYALKARSSPLLQKSRRR